MNVEISQTFTDEEKDKVLVVSDEILTCPPTFSQS
jgi:hypothetical protein